jgi:hypothetical protein
MSTTIAPKKSVSDIMEFVIEKATQVGAGQVRVKPTETEGFGNNLVRQGGTMMIGTENYRLNVREDTSRPKPTTAESNPAKLVASHKNARAAIGLGDVEGVMAINAGKYAQLAPSPDQKIAAQNAAEDVPGVRRSIEVGRKGEFLQFDQTIDAKGVVDFVTKGDEPKSFSSWLKEEIAKPTLGAGVGAGKSRSRAHIAAPQVKHH